MGFVIELQDRAGRAVGFHKSDKSTCIVGRGYDCDLILDDPYVDVQHVKVTSGLDGLRIEILSREGRTTVGQHKDASGDMPVASGTAVVLGKTRLAIYAASHKVANVRKNNSLDNCLDKLASPLIAGCVIFLFLSMDGAEEYFNFVGEFAYSEWLVSAAASFFIALAWAAVSALVTKVIRGEARFLQHLVVVLIFFLLLQAWEILRVVVEFNLGNHIVVTVINSCVLGILIATLLWIQLRLAVKQKPWSRFATANAISWGLIGYGLLNSYSFEQMYSNSPRFEATLLPTQFLFRSTLTEEEFWQAADDLFVFPEEEE